MDECESLDAEMTELQEFQSEASEAISQDDEDEVEELQNSLREVVQDQSVKPKLQCLMVDPAFSMVTVQSEDSGIVWETASSRCSTPWASETSSISEGCSTEGSGAAGKITIVFDEEKIVRRRTRSGGRSSRLGDRLSRPGSSRSASALGVERLEMLEVSLPNVKQEKTEAEPDLEEIKNKDQQLFSLISEGYEILNIRVPSKLPTVDEEENTEQQDNLSYLDQTPKIKSRNHHDWTQQQNHVILEERKTPDHQEPSGEESAQADELRHTPTQSGDIDYFEKFTLVDVVAPSKRAPELQEEAAQPAAKPQKEDQKPAKETATDSPSASEESFVFVTDVEIAGDHLDEVFYGVGGPDDAQQRGQDDETEDEARMRRRRESQRSGKENGSVLFGSEQTILTPIYISPGPPKIIDPILLEEPTAMSFMYSDLYEDAVGERKKSDEEAESVVSERSFRRRLSDSEEADGYLEKFTLKDETPTVEDQPEPTRVKDRRDRKMMWSQSQFEMTGCLIRAVNEEEVKAKTEEPKLKEVSVGERRDLKLATVEEKMETVTETEKEQEEQTDKGASEEPIQELKPTEDQVEDQEVKHEVKEDQTEPPESSMDEGRGPETPQVEGKDEKSESEEHQREVPAEAAHVVEAEQPCQTQGEAEKTAQEVVIAPEETPVTAPATNEAPHVITKSETPAETTEGSSSEEAGTETKTVASDVKVIPEPIAEVKEPETEGQEILVSAEIETSAVTSLGEDKEAADVVPEDVAPVEVITDCDAAVQAVVEVTEKAVDEKEIQTQVQIDLQEASVETRAEAPEAPPEETAAESSQVPESITAALEPDVTAAVPGEVTKPVMPEEVSVDSDNKQHELLESKQHQQEESVTDSESNTTKPTSKAAEEIGVQEMVKVGDEVILLVPKGQAVEMDIEVSQWTEKTPSDAVALSEPDSTFEHLTVPEASAVSLVTPQAPNDEATIKPQLEVKPQVDLKEEATLDNSFSPPEPVEEANAEKQKVECDFEEDKGVFLLSPLRSFTPQEDLSGLHREEKQSGEAGVEQMSEIPKVEDAPETIIVEEESGLEIDLHKEDIQSVEVETEQKSETHKVEDAVETTVVKETSGAELDLHVEDLKPEARDQMPKEEDAPETIVVKEDSGQEIDLLREDKQTAEADTEHKSETHEAEGAPETTKTDEDSGPEIFLHREEDIEERVEMCKVEDAPETRVEDSVPEIVLHREDMLSKGADVEEKAEMQKVEDAQDTAIVKEDSGPEADVLIEDIQSEDQKAEIHKVEDALETSTVKSPVVDLLVEDVGKKMERQEAVTEEIIEELEYEMISEHDAKEILKPETPRDAEEPKPEPVQEREEVEVEVEMEEEEEEEKAFDLSPEEELIEADYDIIDAEEEKQARLAAELQGMDWFCVGCGCLLSEDDCASGEHHDHQVITVDRAYEDIKEKLSDWISELQSRSENIEDLVSELELAYNSVEDHCVETEAAMQAQNEEMMALVMEQYNNMSVSMEEEKKAKLEQLYDQIVSFQESIDSTKATLETSAREAETDARPTEDIEARLREALDSAMSLELGPKGLLVFEDYAKGNTSSSHLAQRKGIPVPQRPTLQPQEPGSATCTSVTVYWKVNPGDIIDCFQVYCMEDPHGAVSEEYRVTVKESYCVLEDLEPDKTYKVWVMAVNYTGCSLPSERLTFRTAPSVPVIDTERCTVMWDSATLRWSSEKQTPEYSYTLEYCRQYELEGEGLRSISGIKSCEQKVLLQPSENYLFYIKAVNEAGASEQSEAALISTKGTRFHLLKDSAHPALELSVDQTTLHYSQEAHQDTPPTDQRCPSILGELLLARGHHYWETIVSGSMAYRLGVAYSTANRNSPLGENSLSWCLQCIPTPSGCRFQLLHNDVQASVFVIEMPERVGTLLDYQLGRLSFYNAQSGQLIGTFSQRFTQPCHPALGLEMPGSLEVSMVPEVPEFTKDS